MAATLASELQIEAELIKGDNGIFDVIADGEIVFSKDEQGRFPDPNEIVEALRSA